MMNKTINLAYINGLYCQDILEHTYFISDSRKSKKGMEKYSINENVYYIYVHFFEKNKKVRI